MSGIVVFNIVNIVGANIVLGGYAISLSIYPGHREALWGGITGDNRIIFTI